MNKCNEASYDVAPKEASEGDHMKNIIYSTIDIHDYFKENNVCSPHWREDTIEFADQRLVILKEHFKDDAEALKKLDNLEFRLATDFTTGESRPALFLRDASVLGRFEKMFTGRGWNTRDASFTTIKDTSLSAKVKWILWMGSWDIRNEGVNTNITRDQEFDNGVYFRRNDEWEILPDAYMFFKNDLIGLDGDWLGKLWLSPGYKGIWLQCLAHGKTLPEIQAHLPPINAQLDFLNQIPWDNAVRAFLTNQSIMGFREKDWSYIWAGWNSAYLASISSQPEGVSYGPGESGNSMDTSRGCSLNKWSISIKHPQDAWFGRHIGLQVRFLSDEI